MNRKKKIVGISILIVLAILVIAGTGLLLSRLKKQPQAHQRLLVSDLVYCNANELKPCIVSFSVDADGNMLVNITISGSSYPDFYLTITQADTVNKYECQKTEDLPTNVNCTGKEMYPGQTLQFTLISMEDGAALAEGKFAIIGLLLPSPQAEVTETPTLMAPPAMTEEPPTETPTALILEIFTPLPTKSSSIIITPSPTELTPSYPNPSYP